MFIFYFDVFFLLGIFSREICCPPSPLLLPCHLSHQIADSDDFYQHFDPDHCKLPKTLMSQFLRAPVIQPAKTVVPSSSAVPPQFATISMKRFEGENFPRLLHAPEFMFLFQN